MLQRTESGTSGDSADSSSAPPARARSASPPLVGTSPRSHRRVLSTLAAKKKLASALGETAVGRATVLRVLGPEGDAVVSALKSAVTRMDDRATAKQMKKDLFKWTLKASVLWQHHKLTRDNTAALRRPAQLCLERLLDEHDRAPAGQRDMSRASRDMAGLGAQLRPLLEPHARDKNVGKLERLVEYYADADFLSRLFNDADFAEDRDALVAAVRAMLLPLPRALPGRDALLAAQARSAALAAQLRAPRLAHCLHDEFPELGLLFAAHLDAREGTRALGVMLRFLRAERDFAQLASPALRLSRGRVLVGKFLAAPGARPLSQDAEELARLRAALEGGSLGRDAFKPVRGEFLDRLQSAFQTFLAGSAYAEYAEALRQERAGAEQLLADFKEDLRTYERHAQQQQRRDQASQLALPAPLPRAPSPAGLTCAQAV